MGFVDYRFTTEGINIKLTLLKYLYEGTLEFSLVGYVTQTFPVELSEGAEITQDVSLEVE